MYLHRLNKIVSKYTWCAKNSVTKFEKDKNGISNQKRNTQTLFHKPVSQKQTRTIILTTNAQNWLF